MNSLRKMAAFILSTVIVFHLAGQQVIAVAPVGNSGEQNTLRINITSKPVDETDFVKVFPETLCLCVVEENTIVNPMEQMVSLESVQYEDVPNYFQQDYPDALYGEGTVASHGSSITALAMIATYLTEYNYTPDELARWFSGKGINDIERLSFAAEALGLKFDFSSDWQHTYEQLQNGKYILIQIDSQSVLSDDVHFVVLKGMTADGKILVNDPAMPTAVEEEPEAIENPEPPTEEPENKYITGFEETDISTGFCNAWIFDINAIPEDIVPYTDLPVIKEKSRYESLKLTPAEKQLLARVVSAYASGECEEGQQMLVEVILNRMLSDDYPNELKEIVYGVDGLFDISHLNKAELTRIHYLAVERALYGQFGEYLLEEDVTDLSFVCHE